MNGVVVSIETFRKELIKRGHRVFVIAPKPYDKNYHEEDPYVFRVPSITTIFKKDYPFGLPYFTEIPKIIPDMHLDIIHVQHSHMVGRFGRRLAKKYKIPTIYTYHTLLAEYAHYSPIFQGLVEKILISESTNFANTIDQVIAPSQTIKDLIIGYGVKTPIEVLATGIPIKEYGHSDQKEIRKKYQIDPNSKILIYVGRLAEEKNISFLLKAYQKIHLKFPATHLILVGGGEDEKSIKNLAKDLKLENITWTEALPKPETNKVFGAGDIFLMPSLTDTQAIVVVEAMASGLPCVVIDKFGPAEIVEEEKSGFKIKVGDINSFVDTTVKLLKDNMLRNEMSKNAVMRAKEYDSGKQTEKLLKLYERVINNKKYDYKISK
jgi:glycosyltransferase involved in cell wall biosynthesis